MFGLPTNVQVGGVKVKVRWKPTLDDSWGTYDHDLKTIFLSKKLPEEERLPTLLHEMVHASLAISGLNEMLTAKQEEAIVRNFDSMVLPAVLKVLPDR